MLSVCVAFALYLGCAGRGWIWAFVFAAAETNAFVVRVHLGRDWFLSDAGSSRSPQAIAGNNTILPVPETKVHMCKPSRKYQNIAYNEAMCLLNCIQFIILKVKAKNIIYVSSEREWR
jgi:hypothetical protein